MKVDFSICRLNNNTTFKNNYRICKTQLEHDKFQNSGFVIKFSAQDLLGFLRKSGMKTLDVASTALLLKKLNISRIDYDIFNALSAIYTKEKKLPALKNVLKIAYDPTQVHPSQVNSFILTCAKFYEFESNHGTTDINTAILLAKNSLQYDIYDDDVDVANFLSKKNNQASILKKLNQSQVVDAALNLNKIRLLDGTNYIGCNPEKIDAFCDLYFDSKTQIDFNSALKLANLVMSDENPYCVDFDKFNFAYKLLTTKTNGRKINGEDALKFCDFIFNEPLKVAKQSIKILNSEYNATTSSARINMDAILEMSKMVKDGYPHQYLSLFEDYYGIISRIQTNEAINIGNHASLAAAITRSIPLNLTNSRYLPLDIEKMYKYYYDKDIPADLIAKLLVESYLNQTSYREAERRLKDYINANTL